MIETWYAAQLASVNALELPGGSERYFLKPGYQSRARSEYFVDETGDVVYQPDVYPLAAAAARGLGASILIDVGCGWAQKLVQCAGNLETMGIDVGENLSYCSKTYPDRRWLECDLDQPHTLPVMPDELRRAVIICSDVIEHVLHPEYLLRSLRAALDHARLLILSTPERDLARGIGDNGPPANGTHVREWNLSEFALLLEYYGLPLRRIGLTRSDDRRGVTHTILALVGQFD